MSVTLERMKQIVTQEDPELVARLFVMMSDHIESQKQLIKKIEAEKAAKDQQGFTLEEKVKLLRRQLFGRSKEERIEASDRPRDKSQEAAQIFSQATFPSMEKRSEDQKNKAKGQDLPERVIEQRPTDAALVAEGTLRGFKDPSPSQWMDTGLYDECTKIQIIERSYVREIHRKMKYKLRPEFNPTDKDIFVTAGAPELLPGMNYTTDFVVSVVSDKYISHMPLERQTREMESLGLKGVQNSTLSRLSALAAASLEPLQERILRKDILTSRLSIHIDETPWKIQNRHEKDGFMWVISNHCGSYYFFEPTRSAQVIKSRLEGYDGPVMTDGYRSYDSVLEELSVPRAHCWSHARREFLPLETHDPTVKPILDCIDRLFEIERMAKDFEGLASLRLQKGGPELTQLKTILNAELPRSRPGSQKRKAIEYTLSRWNGLTLFLNDTRIPLSNNEAERTIRHSVVGRKNYYGAGSHSGAATAATLFTVIESCKKNDLDPRTFLAMSLHRVAAGEELETPLAYARRTRSAQAAT
jgi:transposase